MFVADMEEPCLLGLDFLVQSAARLDLDRMEMRVRGEVVPLILEGVAEQVESSVTGSEVEDDVVPLHCRAVIEGELPVTRTARGREGATAASGIEAQEAGGGRWRSC